MRRSPPPRCVVVATVVYAIRSIWQALANPQPTTHAVGRRIDVF
jgi:hypothetical protein